MEQARDTQQMAEDHQKQQEPTADLADTLKEQKVDEISLDLKEKNCDDGQQLSVNGHTNDREEVDQNQEASPRIENESFIQQLLRDFDQTEGINSARLPQTHKRSHAQTQLIKFEDQKLDDSPAGIGFG